jgi:hypothetical protein
MWALDGMTPIMQVLPPLIPTTDRSPSLVPVKMHLRDVIRSDYGTSIVTNHRIGGVMK